MDDTSEGPKSRPRRSPRCHAEKLTTNELWLLQAYRKIDSRWQQFVWGLVMQHAAEVDRAEREIEIRRSEAREKVVDLTYWRKRFGPSRHRSARPGSYVRGPERPPGAS